MNAVAHPEKQRILGCILAGGRSSRMGGGDKTLADLGGRPMLARIVERAAPQVGDLLLNANGDPDRFKTFRLHVCADPLEGFPGPLGGVLAGLRHATNKGGWTHVTTFAADTPFFPQDIVAKLASAAGRGNAIVLAASHSRMHPVFALWPASIVDDLARFLEAGETYRVLSFIERHGFETVDFAMTALDDGGTLDPFFNVNTPEDLAYARQVVRKLGLRE